MSKKDDIIKANSEKVEITKEEYEELERTLSKEELEANYSADNISSKYHRIIRANETEVILKLLEDTNDKVGCLYTVMLINLGFGVIAFLFSACNAF